MPARYNPVDAVVYGWTAFSRNAAPFLLLALVSVAASLGPRVAVNVVTTGSVIGGRGPEVIPDLDEMLADLAVSLGATLGSVLVSWIVGVAMMRGAIDVVDTGRTSLGAMFTRIRWGSALGAAILTTLAVFAGLVACFVPALIIGYLLWFTLPAVIDGESATGALSASYEFTTSRVAEVLLFVLFCFAMGLVVTFTMGLAALVVAPVATIGMAYTWRVLQGRPVVPMT